MVSLETKRALSLMLPGLQVGVATMDDDVLVEANVVEVELEVVVVEGWSTSLMMRNQSEVFICQSSGLL